MKKLLIGVCLIIFSCFSASSQDSCNLRISLLTCTPGAELYSTFGHTAIRVTDSKNGFDVVFNYGTFEFTDDFYIKFIRGKLNYCLSVEEYGAFFQSYQAESRSIIEQVLDLNCNEKQQLFAALQLNAREENRFYLYDFLYDNCTTRAKDIITKNADGKVAFKEIFPADHPSFRNLIHSYLDKGGLYWSKFGIDLVLGAKLDKKVSNEEGMFLPDYLMQGMDGATVVNRPLVKEKVTVLSMPSPLTGKTFLTPIVVFSLLLLIVAWFSIKHAGRSAKYMVWFDQVFFLGLGLAGLLLLFMWLGTDHKVTKNNYNLLWALPVHIAAPFIIKNHNRFSKWYFTATMWLTIAILLLWYFLPQQFNLAVIPILLLIILRSWQLSKYNYGRKAV